MANHMETTKDEIRRFVEENDIKFIRLTFCDLFGVQKNISIMPDELETAFEDGISFDASAISGFCGVANSDLFLKPEPSTLSLLPWRPQQGRVARFYCSIFNPDGSPFEFDSRFLLKRALDRFRTSGFECRIGAECEFYLFMTDEYGDPTYTPFDAGGYLDIAPVDKCENLRREICLTIEEMGLHPEASHHEQGPGQNEIDFKFADAMTSADDLMTFKTAVKAVAARNGLFASFLPKPLVGKSGSGMHINISLSKDGINIFQADSGYREARDSFIAGILSKIKEISLFLNPLPNSYERLGELEAPGYITWSKNNRSQLVRIPAASGARSRMELRSPDPSANPYLAYSLILSAGVYGIENRLALCDPCDIDIYAAGKEVLSGLGRLPSALQEAVDAAKSSDFVKGVLGERLLEKFIQQKSVEARDYRSMDKRSELARAWFASV